MTPPEDACVDRNLEATAEDELTGLEGAPTKG